MPLPELPTLLADRYRLEEEAGAGGMATVYLAEDVKHHRRVAVKVLRPELAAALGHERFLREITTTANLRHPHILPLYDSGEADGVLFYVMPYVEGETLRERLDREKQLPIDEALEITREVADALNYAHSRGVIHRDIKPENILLESGHAVVADFGIARAVTAAGGGTLTHTGTTLGTPAYMSPEQAAGERDLDGRSDLYALGCVLFEMLAGQPPFTGPTVESIVHQHLTADPPAISRLRPAVPGAVVAAVQRALAKTPADRFNPVVQFVEALAPDTRAVAVPPPAAGASTPDRSIAVLPFASMSGDPENEMFADGITEEIINALAQIGGLQVAARTSCFAFKGKTLNITQVGAQLRVATVLEGSVRKAGDRLRITAQLISVADGYHIWSERYDRKFDDVFAIQDEIAGAIANRLRGTLTGARAAAPKAKAPPNLEAYQSFLKGRAAWNQRDRAGLQRAVECFQQAIERDANYAAAWAGLADAYLLQGSYGLLPLEQAHRKAREAVDRALELDESLAEAHATRGQLLRHERDRAGEEREYQRAIELNPNYATAHQWYATLLAALGRLPDAIREIRRAEELDPLSHAVSVTVAVVLFYDRQYAASLAQLERAIALEPSFASAYAWVGWACVELGRPEEAIAAIGRAAELNPDNPNVHVAEAVALVRMGKAQEAVACAEQAIARGARGWPAMVWGYLGDFDRAFAEIERALQEGESWESLFYLNVNPWWQPLRADPRFEDLRNRLNLPR